MQLLMLETACRLFDPDNEDLFTLVLAAGHHMEFVETFDFVVGFSWVGGNGPYFRIVF